MRLPASAIAGADQVIEGALFEASSGNRCAIWPAMTEDREAHQTRIAFMIQWERPSTPADQEEVTAMTDEFLGMRPIVSRDFRGDPRQDPEATEWLRTGKMPPPPRTN